MNIGEFQAMWDRKANSFKYAREAKTSQEEIREGKMNGFVDDLTENFNELKMPKSHRRFFFKRHDCYHNNAISVFFRGKGWFSEGYRKLEITWEGFETFRLGGVDSDGNYYGLFTVCSYDELLASLVDLINKEIDLILRK